MAPNNQTNSNSNSNSNSRSRSNSNSNSRSNSNSNSRSNTRSNSSTNSNSGRVCAISLQPQSNIAPDKVFKVHGRRVLYDADCLGNWVFELDNREYPHNRQEIPQGDLERLFEMYMIRRTTPPQYNVNHILGIHEQPVYEEAEDFSEYTQLYE